MKKFIPFLLFFCLSTNSCSVLRQTKESLDSVFSPYFLIQNYSISASRKKTYVKATVYYSQLRENSKQKFPSKIEFNGIEMNKGLLKYEPDYASPCDETEKESDSNQIDNPEIKILSVRPKTAEPTTKESDYFFVSDGYNKETTVTITNPNNKIETYQINFDPIEFETPDSVKISRSKDTLIKLKGKGSGKKEGLKFNLTQGNGISFDEKIMEFDQSSQTIKIPAKLLKQFKKGRATFSLYSYIYEPIKTPGLLTGNSFSLSFTDEICAEIID